MFLTTLCVLPATALAYIGPGGGLSAIGALIALVAAVALAFIGFVWYPMKRLRRKLRTPEAKPNATPARPPQQAASVHK